MCGEHKVGKFVMPKLAGSSPHVRGAQIPPLQRVFPLGIIPACAGSTIVYGLVQGVLGDHPRMCGEHLYNAGASIISGGSSPHVRGAHPWGF